jgi:hypothetical protein
MSNLHNDRAAPVADLMKAKHAPIMTNSIPSHLFFTMLGSKKSGQPAHPIFLGVASC